MGKWLQTVAAVTCMKTLLILFNVIFWISGVAILSLGMLMLVELHKYIDISAEFSATVPYVLIGCGAFIIVIGLLAFCCTAKGQPVLLYLYAAFLLVVFVVLLGSGISGYAYRERLKTGYEDGLNRAFTEYERNPTLTTAVDNLQNTIHCCGIHNVSDWMTTPYGQANERSYPISCCKDVVDGACTGPYNQGCYYTVVHLLESNAGIVIISAFSFAAFQVVGVVLACCLARNINKARYEQV